VARPADWGGYRVVPERIEFWQQGEHRLHDRIRYRRQGPRWIRERLAP
jgi:pyridoxamine 5'-phosphate oxidase